MAKAIVDQFLALNDMEGEGYVSVLAQWQSNLLCDLPQMQKFLLIIPDWMLTLFTFGEWPFCHLIPKHMNVHRID